jgi:hypothetical protein
MSVATLEWRICSTQSSVGFSRGYPMRGGAAATENRPGTACGQSRHVECQPKCPPYTLPSPRSGSSGSTRGVGVPAAATGDRHRRDRTEQQRPPLRRGTVAPHSLHSLFSTGGPGSRQIVTVDEVERKRKSRISRISARPAPPPRKPYPPRQHHPPTLRAGGSMNPVRSSALTSGRRARFRYLGRCSGCRAVGRRKDIPPRSADVADFANLAPEAWPVDRAPNDRRGTRTGGDRDPRASAVAGEWC